MAGQPAFPQSGWLQWCHVRRLQNPCKRRFQVSVFRFQEDATSCGSSWYPKP